jgi:hypothetical protein
MASMQISSPRPVGRTARISQRHNMTNRRLPRIDLKKMLKMEIDPTMCKKTKTKGKMSIAKLPDFAGFRREFPASYALLGDTLRRLSGFHSLGANAICPFAVRRLRATPYNEITREGVENKEKMDMRDARFVLIPSRQSVRRSAQPGSIGARQVRVSRFRLIPCRVPSWPSQNAQVCDTLMKVPVALSF